MNPMLDEFVSVCFVQNLPNLIYSLVFSKELESLLEEKLNA